MDLEVGPTTPERLDQVSMSVLLAWKDTIFLSGELGCFDLRWFDACPLLMIY
jgi:hypothetical protein